MKTKLLILGFLIFATYTKGYSQKIMEVNMNDKDCIHVIDGLISSPNESVPDKLAHFEQAVSQEKLEKLGFGNSQCVMVKSSADLDIEGYIYRQVHKQVQQIGTKYKIPIAVNGKLTFNHTDRRNQLSKFRVEQVKNIKFLNKAEAQAKYGDKVVFGLIEITI
ncbi:hypothetical protein [Pontibacter kalidii]|uniref:hypothetical protein n=1 Tax=Pontibacter kalidii TaxID=2592049 RepID=UPI00224FB74C|nr:hypothetical protein [Pontibacter kalidii]